MMRYKKLWVLLFIALVLPLASAQFQPQYSQPTYQDFYSQQGVDYTEFWPGLEDPDKCKARFDFIVNVRPGGCQPMVVRSDLLESQTVPVFCKLDAVKLNPLIDVASLTSVDFKQREPSEHIAGISFHPSNAALRRTRETSLDSPIMNDIGYVVLLLKRMPEKDMPDKITANLTAVLDYDTRGIVGAGESTFYLPTMQDREWQGNYRHHSFWGGKGYLRTDWVEEDRAGISIYSDKNTKVRDFTLEKGETSNTVYIPGFYCQAGARVRLEDISSGVKRARLQIGDYSHWVTEGERILDNQCRVRDIFGLGGGSGLVSLDCRGEEVNLRIDMADEVILQKEDSATSFRTGQKIPDTGQHLVYVGLNETDSRDEVFIITTSGVHSSHIDNENIEAEWLDNVIKDIPDWLNMGKEDLKKGIKNTLGSDEVNIIRVDGMLGDYVFEGVTMATNKGCEDIDEEDIDEEDCENALEKFNEAKEEALNIFNRYGSSKDKSGDYYAANALYDVSDLARKLRQDRDRQELLEKIVDNYPDTRQARNAEKTLKNLEVYSYDHSSSVVTVGRDSEYVALERVVVPGPDEAGAIFEVTFDEESYKKGALEGQEVIKMGEGDRPYIKIKELMEDRIEIEYKTYEGVEEKELVGPRTTILREGSNWVITDEEGNEKRIALKEINFERIARVNLISDAKGTTSEADFSVSVGIEKRMIDLNPERTKERIENINESIEDWENMRDGLGEVVKVWKGACFTTSTALTVKNLFENLGGGATARKEVMDSHWKQYCAEYSEDKDITVDECYARHNDEIENSVDALAGGMGDMNDKISDMGEGRINEEMKDEFADFVRDNEDLTVTIGDDEKSLREIFGEDDEKVRGTIEETRMTTNEMRNIMVYGRMRDEEPDIGEKLFSRSVSPVESRARDVQTRVNFRDGVRDNISPDAYINSVDGVDGETVRTFNLEGGQVEGLSEGEYTILNTKEGDVILTKVRTVNERIMYENLNEDTDHVGHYIDDGGKLLGEVTEEDVRDSIESERTGLKKISRDQCDNTYKNPEVRFHETGPQKGMPAVIPIDTDKGWYAATEQAVGGGFGFGGIKPFEGSGEVSSMYLCNVGPDGMEDWNRDLNDDICTQINYNTGQPLDQLGCITGREAENLARRAKRMVEDAAAQYHEGRDRIVLNGESYDIKPAISRVGYECQDFMSPKDCKILFNACDPVLCPTSRCDFGGTYPVQDVVQSGIVGSVLLCSPNFVGFGGDVYMPVCLTGIHAGMDAWVSIMKAHRDCLQENLDSGEYIGICDQMYSVYGCEFFWRHAGPLVDLGLPKLVEFIYAGGQRQERGGGEYMTVRDAWDNMEDSISYMTDHYGVEAFDAFKDGSVSQIGSEFCRAMISTSYPDGVESFDQLLEPDSPAQFYARFDEISYSDATVPPTSQYKVYYHIFGGRDRGRHYSVYLTNPPDIRAHKMQDTLMVDQGYVGAGESIDLTETMTAPSGYSELCVRIDGREECGFKQVTTDFSMNYLQDKYAEEQAKQEITSEQECIEGTKSPMALAQPSLQGGVEEAIDPAIYERGITRTCSSKNPGGEGSDRWTNVGYCDEHNGIGCWLDKHSVEDSIRRSDIQDRTIQEADKILEDEVAVNESGIIWNREATERKLNEAGKEENDEIRKGLLRDIVNHGFLNEHKAKALYNIVEIHIDNSMGKAVISKMIKGSEPGEEPIEDPEEDQDEKDEKDEEEVDEDEDDEEEWTKELTHEKIESWIEEGEYDGDDSYEDLDSEDQNIFDQFIGDGVLEDQAKEKELRDLRDNLRQQLI